jgi:ABC-2 type transport system ATP-binding protein
VNNILQLERVTGGYSHLHPIIRNISFEVGPGEMVGLIGLNGAGKSTTIKHILGLLEPTAGIVSIKGITRHAEPEVYRAAYSYVPETPMLYDELTVREHLQFAAMAYGLEQRDYEDRLEQVADIFQMTQQMDRLPLHLSKGMRQKVMIMIAFLVKPELYIIDEPFLGLDPLAMRRLLEFMVIRKQEGAAILVSSHILSTIERYCERFVLIHHGEIRAYGSLEKLREEAHLPDGTLDDVFLRFVQEV